MKAKRKKAVKTAKPRSDKLANGNWVILLGKLENARNALRVIRTWASVQIMFSDVEILRPVDTKRLCDEALKNSE